jgi:hypothetical protein
MASVVQSSAITPRSHGSRWLAAIGVDHAFALHSVLVVADVVAERFQGLYSKSDWTAEVGLRQQLTPTIVLDVGVSRRFSSAIPSTAATLGASYSLATRRWIR